ncbi:hypothetical protein OHC33_006165 [Knufia fluminis]|uniref:Manganese/iron superoxide dismutase C-terminal domain-containing protein n=1 Tax=Knufia fluminis TaxID=191047 RepID=A0AAN8EUS2_9EURO|nr:hypothetical protein OHC33_006165 [Knufia fluminis]
MILRRIARPQAIAKQFEKISSPAILQQCRFKHSVPPLGGPNNEKGEYFSEHGVPGFLSPKTYRQAWKQYQQHLVDQLDELTVGSEYEHKTPHVIHTQMSRQPQYAYLYNISAMACFNHLWWEGISDVKKSVPENLRKDIEESFHSMDSLRNEMLESADAMFGNGFVWLMKESVGQAGVGMHSNLRILCTYNAGSPYAEAWKMKQDKESSTGLNVQERNNIQMNRPQNTVGSFGRYSQQGKDGSISSNSLQAIPLLCLNTWQHMWIPDYGILGKRSYLGAWWDRIDWDVVYQRYNHASRTAGMAGNGYPYRR